MFGNMTTSSINTTAESIRVTQTVNETTSAEMDNIRMPDAYMKIASGSVSVLGIVGNLIVIVVISRSTMLRKTFTNILILNQSCIDFASSCCIMITTTSRTQVEGLSGIMGEIYCRFWLSDLPLWSFMISSSYTLILLTVERYIAIVYPIFHHTSFKRTTVLALAIAAWFPGFIYMLCFLVPTSGVTEGRCMIMEIFASASWKKFTGVMLFIIQYLIPIAVFLTCYSRIIAHLRSRVHPQLPQSVGNEAVSIKARARRNVLKTLTIIVVCYLLCNSWNQFLFLAHNFGYPIDYSGAFYNFTVIAMFANSCINPIIYVLKYEAYQKEFRKIFFKCGANTPTVTTS